MLTLHPGTWEFRQSSGTAPVTRGGPPAPSGADHPAVRGGQVEVDGVLVDRQALSKRQDHLAVAILQWDPTEQSPKLDVGQAALPEYQPLTP
jgi:hypothetical protein